VRQLTLSGQLFVFDLRKSAVLLTTSETKFAESTEEINQVCDPVSRAALSAADTVLCSSR
jgi:hypothetical protein